MAKHRARDLQECLPCLSELHTARAPQKELCAKLLLDEANSLAEWRLLHTKPLCSARHVTFLGHRDEIPKVSEFHCHIATDMHFAE